MPHPKRILIAEERALANSYAEHARRLQRSQHPHFRHDLEPRRGRSHPAYDPACLPTASEGTARYVDADRPEGTRTDVPERGTQPVPHPSPRQTAMTTLTNTLLVVGLCVVMLFVWLGVKQDGSR